MTKIKLVSGKIINKTEKYTIFVNSYKGQSIRPSYQQIILIVHFTIDLSVDELYSVLIGNTYSYKYEHLKKNGAPEILIEIYRILTLLRNCIMHNPSSVQKAEEYFLNISHQYKNKTKTIKIKEKIHLDHIFYVACQLSDLISRFGARAFGDKYMNLILNSIYNYAINGIQMSDQHGCEKKINMPLSISWRSRLWVARDAHDLIGTDGKLLDGIKAIKSPTRPLEEQYDYVFNINSEIYAIPNEYLIQNYKNIRPILLTEVLLSTFKIYNNFKHGEIEYLT